MTKILIKKELKVKMVLDVGPGARDLMTKILIKKELKVAAASTPPYRGRRGRDDQNLD